MMKIFLSVLVLIWAYGFKKASPDHLFFNAKQEYVISQNTIPGSSLLNKDGETIEVYNVSKKDTVTEVYDLLTQDGEYSAGESALMTETYILRIIGENTGAVYKYPNLRNNYNSLNLELFTAQKVVVENGIGRFIYNTTDLK